MKHVKHVFCGFLLSSLLMACGSSSHAKDEQDPGQPDTESVVESSQSAAAPGSLVPWRGELWVDQYSHAANDARSMQHSKPEDARRIQYIASQPMAQWLGEWSGDVEGFVRRAVSQAGGKILTLVLYHIPYRDCGSYSAGGSEPGEYRRWVEGVARGLGSHPAILIVEPDALAQMDCLPQAAQSERLALLQDAVHILKKTSAAKIYLDAGHPAWHSVDIMAERLLQGGVRAADGFALNVSNFQTLETNISYGRSLRSRLGGKNFVIDTSRNGRGPDPDGAWCNPRSRALGQAPSLQTGTEGVDAFLWVKRPGESDGSCNGGPGAGQWWREIALEMAQGAGI
jgi:endoglucanase